MADQKVRINDKQEAAGSDMNARAVGIIDQPIRNMGFASKFPNEFSFKSLNKIEQNNLTKQ